MSAIEATHHPEDRPLGRSLRRGFLCRCPSCGKGRAFGKFLKSVPNCSACGEDLSHHRADDAPPYFTMVLVGHITVPIIVAVQMETELSNLTHLAIWLPFVAILSLVLLQPIKGAVIGLQWALRMHGFDANAPRDDLVWSGTIDRSEPQRGSG